MPPVRLPAHHKSAVLVAVATVAVGCSAGPDPLETARAVAGTEVAVVDNRFEPPVLQAAPGQAVTWTWQGQALHDVVGEGFATELQREGTFTHTFEEPGEHDYVCTIHSRMRGRVVVTEP